MADFILTSDRIHSMASFVFVGMVQSLNGEFREVGCLHLLNKHHTDVGLLNRQPERCFA